MKKKATNPFQIGVQRNEQMGCWDLHLQIGNIASKEEAKAMADAIVEWLKGDSPNSWSQRVS
jgi:hypothetical protein